ncbi:hypothetical protein ACQPW1_36270 [Nocardia sp. CA-128927]|uniref:hypothetical protein n=1 Tax=Nocardia sp. CA-128927 TaxID=3239975 RepID=UPI003D983212
MRKFDDPFPDERGVTVVAAHMAYECHGLPQVRSWKRKLDQGQHELRIKSAEPGVCRSAQNPTNVIPRPENRSRRWQDQPHQRTLEQLTDPLTSDPAERA